MNLSELDIKLGYSIVQRIKEEFDEFKASMYAGKTLEERKDLDQFFTPPEVTIPLLESLLDSYDEDDKTFANKDILDPTSGTGNLLMACIIAGADPRRVYGNDYDGTMVKKCLERLNKYCLEHELALVPEINIHQGNALQKRCLTEFSQYYNDNYGKAKDQNGKKIPIEEFLNDLTYAQGKYSWNDDNTRVTNSYNYKLKLAQANMEQQNKPKDETGFNF